MICKINEFLFNDDILVVENKNIVARKEEDTLSFSENDNDVVIINNKEMFKFYCHTSEYNYDIVYNYKEDSTSASIKLKDIDKIIPIGVERFKLTYKEDLIEMIYKLESNETTNKLIIEIKQ